MPGATLGYLKFVLGFDTIAFKKGMTAAEKDLVSFQKKVEKFGKGMADVGKVMTFGITAPLIAFGVASSKAASDANELQSAFNVTFGAMSGAMNKWAEEQGNAMGRSTQTMQDAANTFGIFFNTAVDPKKAAEMSKTFAVLAQDLGSFFNVKPGDAMEKLRAGLSGEAEPLRKFGIFLNEAKVQAKGVELGLVKTGEKMTDQQKIVARYNLILEATTKAQGDVARTSDSAANQQVALQEAYKELSVVVGNKLLPALTPLVAALASALTWFTNLDQPTQEWVLGLLAVAAAAGPVLILVGNMIKLFAGAKVLVLFAQGLLGVAAAEGATATGATAAGIAIRGMLGPIALAVAAVTAVYLAWKHWDKIWPIIQAVGKAIKEWFGRQFDRIMTNVKVQIESVERAFKWLADKVAFHSYVPDMVDAIGAAMARLQKEMVEPAQKGGKKTADAMREMASEVAAIMDRLFPEQARLRQFQDELKKIEKSKLPVEVAEKLKAALTDEFARDTIGPEAMQSLDDFAGQFRFDPDIDQLAEPDTTTIADMEFDAKEANREIATDTKRTTDDMIQAWGHMAEEAVYSMKDMVVAFKSGDIMGGILSLLELILEVTKTLSSLGAFGGGGATAGGAAVGARNGFGGFRAMGGPVVPGKSYVVGENGPEWFSSKKRGYINPGREAAPTRVIVVPSPYFDTVVDHRAAAIAAPMAGQAAIIGVTGSEARFARRSRRNLLAA